jgi:hypothetical protein
MNPYLEAIWHDFHERFLPAAAAYLVPQVRPKYIVLIEETVYLHESLSYLNVLDRESREVVTVVELLSPTNKRPGEHRAQYLAKRSAVRQSEAHLVEIDLLRGGLAMPAEERPGCTYSVLVSRAGRRPHADFRPFGLRDPLPTVPVPLRTEDGDARLDVRAILDRVYDESGYEDFIYKNEPDPPLTSDDAAWARSYLPSPGGIGGSAVSEISTNIVDEANELRP